MPIDIQKSHILDQFNNQLHHPTFIGETNTDEDIWDVFKRPAATVQELNNVSHSSACSKHDNFIIDHTSGSKICGNCGVIVKKQMIDQEAEWRNLESNNQFSSDPIRCAIINPLLPNSSLSTKIVTRGRENSHLSRLNRWQSMPHSERSAYEVFQEIDSKGRDHNVCGAVLMSAKQFYLRVSQKNTALQVKGEKREGLRGGKRQGLIAACLLYACKQHNMPHSQAQVAEILGYKKSDVTRGSNIFLNLIKNDPSLTNSVNDIIDGHHFIRHFGMMLDVDYFIIKYSIEVYDYVKKMGILSGNTAPSIASGCIFLVLESFCPGLHESTIANTCGISKVTVLNVYKQLLPHRLQLLSYIFSNRICHSLQIDNPITIDKIHKLCKMLAISINFNDIHPQLLAATVIYFVMLKIANGKLDNTFKTRFYSTVSPWTEMDLVICGRHIIWYQSDILNFFFNLPVMPKSLRKDMILLKPLVEKTKKRERETIIDETNYCPNEISSQQQTTTTTAKTPTNAGKPVKPVKPVKTVKTVKQNPIPIHFLPQQQKELTPLNTILTGNTNHNQSNETTEPQKKKRKYQKKTKPSAKDLMSDLEKKYIL